MAAKSHHVLPSPRGGWAVWTGGAARASKLFDTKVAAERYAREVSAKQHSELVIHRRDGTIQRKASHGEGRGASRDES